MYDAEGNHLQQRVLPDGSSYRVVKHFFSDHEVHTIFAPYATDLSIEYFEPQRRVVIRYALNAVDTSRPPMEASRAP